MIRNIKIEDYKDIASLNIQMGYELTKEEVKERINKVLNSTKDIILVYSHSDKIVGYIHASPYETLYSDSLLNILGLVVDEEFRRRGIGKELVQALEMWAKQNNYIGIRLNSGISREAAHSFYKKCGYIGNKEQKRFYKLF